VLPTIEDINYTIDEGGDIKTIITTISSNINNTLDLDKLYNPKLSYRENRINFLRILDKNPQIKFLKTKNTQITKDVNYHNSFMSEDGFKNFIIHKLIGISQNPRNQVASNSPISFGVFTDITKKLSSAYALSNYDGHTTFKQQEQNAVGRRVIGIAATALKDYFGLVQYFGNYYSDLKQIDTLHPAYFLRTFNINDKTYIKSKITGLNVSRESNLILQEHLLKMLTQEVYKNRFTGEDITKEEIEEIVKQIIAIKPDEDAALIISSILSLATDNAKELMLAKINAGVEFASMHLYMAIMGIDAREATKFMTDENVEKIKKTIKRDFFISGRSSTNVSKIEKINPEKQEIDKNFYKEFIKIHRYSTELIHLGKLFKINQGAKATQEDLYEISNTLSTVLAAQDLAFFANLKIDEDKDIIKQKADYIIKDKPYLESHRTEVEKMLTRMEPLSKEIDVIAYYTNNTYRKIIRDYYNLIKYTFNVFDVLDNLDHFNSMFKAFIYGEKVIKENVLKYKFLKEGSLDILDKALTDRELDDYKIIKEIKLYGNPENPISFSSTIQNRLNNYYDYKVIQQFTKTLDIKINLKALMKYLSITSVNLLRNNKREVLEDSYNIESLPYEDIDLSTEFGLAQFRYLMENYIIPHEKHKHSSNGFLKNYVYTNSGNFNLKHRVSYYQDISNFADLEDLQIGMSILMNNNGNILEEQNSNYYLPINENIDGKLGNVSLLNLLTLYDLIINEGRFGGNRATRYFSKDIKNVNSVARKFVDFQNEFDHTPANLDLLIEELKNSKDKRDIFYLILFGNYNIKRHVTEASLSEYTGITVNKYFNILDSVTDAVLEKEKIHETKKIIAQIKAKNINIDVKCDGL
jgi:hypothetical protein